MNKYYCLLLNGCYDVTKHYVSNGKVCTVIKNALRKEYTDLSTIEEDFMCLDDTITINENSWLVEGSLPIIAKKENNEMIDCISGKIIKYSENGFDISGLSYKKAIPANNEMAKLILETISEETKDRYIKGLQEIENILVSTSDSYHPIKNQYQKVILNADSEKTISVIIHNNHYFNIITATNLYEAKENTITSDLTFISNFTISESDFLKDLTNSKEIISVIEYIKKEKQRHITEYNNYISLNKDRTFSERTKKKVLSIKQS